MIYLRYRRQYLPLGPSDMFFREIKMIYYSTGKLDRLLSNGH
jgi:hypothetical protein